jgi:hypothetical protein
MNRKTDWKLRIGVMMKGAGLLVPVLVLLSAQGPASVRAAGLSLADQVERPVREAIDIRRKTQRDKERWRDEKQKRIALYERLQQEQTALNARQEQLNEERKALQARIADKTGQLARIEEISGQIRPFLDEVMDRLGRFYAGDTPFLKAERQRRMDHLVRVMAEPDVAVSEKFRKIMEALAALTIYGFLTPLSTEEKKLWADLNLDVDIPARAAARYHELLQDHPDERTLRNLILACRKLGNCQGALEALARYAPATQSPDLLMLKADMLYCLKRYPEAEAAYQQVARANTPLAGQAWLLAGYAAWQNDDRISSRQAFEKAAQDKRHRKAALLALRQIRPGQAE